MPNMSNNRCIAEYLTSQTINHCIEYNYRELFLRFQSGNTKKPDACRSYSTSGNGYCADSAQPGNKMLMVALQMRPTPKRSAAGTYHRMKFILTLSSLPGSRTGVLPSPAIIPLAFSLRSQAMFLPRRRISCTPSRSCTASPGLAP